MKDKRDLLLLFIPRSSFILHRFLCVSVVNFRVGLIKDISRSHLPASFSQIIVVLMEQKLSCMNCGAELLPEARFCRQCGQRSMHVAPGSVADATTRILKTPDAQAAFEQQYNPPAGGLVQQGQTQMISGA